MYVSEVGGVSPSRKSYSFHSCVRAGEAACGRGTLLFPWRGFKSSKSVLECRAVSCPSLSSPCPSLIRSLNSF